MEHHGHDHGKNCHQQDRPVLEKKNALLQKIGNKKTKKARKSHIQKERNFKPVGGFPVFVGLFWISWRSLSWKSFWPESKPWTRGDSKTWAVNLVASLATTGLLDLGGWQLRRQDYVGSSCIIATLDEKPGTSTRGWTLLSAKHEGKENLTIINNSWVIEMDTKQSKVKWIQPKNKSQCIQKLC